MSHKITVKDIQDYINTETWDTAASSASVDGSLKRLEFCSVTGDFRVMDHGVVRYLGSSLPDAVQAYNAAL